MTTHLTWLEKTDMSKAPWTLIRSWAERWKWKTTRLRHCRISLRKRSPPGRSVLQSYTDLWRCKNSSKAWGHLKIRPAISILPLTMAAPKASLKEICTCPNQFRCWSNLARVSWVNKAIWCRSTLRVKRGRRWWSRCMRQNRHSSGRRRICRESAQN